MKRKPYKHFFKPTRDDEDTQYVEDNPVPQGRIRYITASSLSDDTASLTTALFGLRKKAGFQKYEGEGTTTALVPARIRKTHHFDAGEKPCWEITGGSETDELTVLFEGYDVFLGED